MLFPTLWSCGSRIYTNTFHGGGIIHTTLCYKELSLTCSRLMVFSIYWGFLQLRTDDERWNWQFDFGSKLTIVSLLCLTMALYAIYYLDIVEDICFFIRIISVHTTISVSWRLKILCIMFKIIALFVITLFAWLYVSVGILMTFGENLHGREEICL
jgi:hypothetical protein